MKKITYNYRYYTNAKTCNTRAKEHGRLFLNADLCLSVSLTCALICALAEERKELW